MNFRICALLLTATVFWTASTATAQILGVKLNGGEIKAAIFGHVWRVSTSDGANFLLTINLDGSGGRDGTDVKGQPFRDIGHFRVDGDKYCRFFENVNNNRALCIDLYRQGEHVIQVLDGRVIAIMKVER